MSEDLHYLRKVSRGIAYILDTLRWYDGEARSWIIPGQDAAGRIKQIIGGVEQAVPNFRYRLKTWLKNYEFHDVLAEISSAEVVPKGWRESFQKFLIFEHLCGPEGKNVVDGLFQTFSYALSEGNLDFAWGVVEETYNYQKALLKGLLEKKKYTFDGTRIVADPSLSDSPVIVINRNSEWINVNYGKTLRVKLDSLREMLSELGDNDSVDKLKEVYQVLKKPVKPISTQRPIPVYPPTLTPSYQPESVPASAPTAIPVTKPALKVPYSGSKQEYPMSKLSQKPAAKPAPYVDPQIAKSSLDMGGLKKEKMQGASEIPVKVTPEPQASIEANEINSSYSKSLASIEVLKKIKLDIPQEPAPKPAPKIETSKNPIKPTPTTSTPAPKPAPEPTPKVPYTEPKAVPAPIKTPEKEPKPKSTGPSAPKKSLINLSDKLINPQDTVSCLVGDLIETEREIYEKEGLGGLRSYTKLPEDVYKMEAKEDKGTKKVKIVIKRT